MVVTEEEILRLLRETGVIMEGHFRLTSGRHSPTFLQCSQVLQYPRHAEALCRQLAAPFAGSGVQGVIGPAVGGIILAYETARALGVRAIFAEREEGRMRLRRGFTISPGERFLVVEDAVTTGGSVNEVLELLAEARARAVGVAMLVDRSGGKVGFGVPQVALVTLDVPSYSPAECPLCRAGVPLVYPKGAAG